MVHRHRHAASPLKSPLIFVHECCRWSFSGIGGTFQKLSLQHEEQGLNLFTYTHRGTREIVAGRKEQKVSFWVRGRFLLLIWSLLLYEIRSCIYMLPSCVSWGVYKLPQNLRQRWWLWWIWSWWWLMVVVILMILMLKVNMGETIIFRKIWISRSDVILLQSRSPCTKQPVWKLRKWFSST